MTFVARAARLRSFTVARFAPVALSAALLVLAAGCEDKHVGRLCDLTVDPDMTETGNTATINPQALECPSRICLLPANEKSATTAALCTAECESDEDCEDGETGDPKNMSDTRCKTGFSCVVPTTVGELCCRRMCACRDFIVIPMSGYRIPAVCQSGSAVSCK